MEPMTTVDLTGEAFAKRLANLLVATRSQQGNSVRAMVRASGHTFTRRQLKSLEEATTPLDEDLIERVSELYGCDLGLILPSRLPVVVGGGVISAGGVVTTFVPGNSTSLLEAYLKLVRALRRQSKAPAVDLRRDDIDVLSGYLQEPGETVVERLAALMGASRTQRTAMAGLFASGAVVIGLVGTAMAGGSGVTSRSALVHGPLHDAIGLVVFEPPGEGGAGSGSGVPGGQHSRELRPAGAVQAANVADDPVDAPGQSVRASGQTAPETPEIPLVLQADAPAAEGAPQSDEEWPSQDLIDDTTVASDVGGGNEDLLSRQANLPPAAPPVLDDQQSDDQQRADEQSRQHEEAAQKKADEDAKQKKADEEAAQHKADEDAKQKKAAEDARQREQDQQHQRDDEQKKADQEAAQKKADEDAKQKKSDQEAAQLNGAEDAKQKKSDQEAAQKKADQEAGQKKSDEDAKHGNDSKNENKGKND